MYILDTGLNDNDYVVYALKNIYGLGKSQSLNICKKLGVLNNLKINELTEDQIVQLLNLVETSDLTITNDLKKLQTLYYQMEINIKSYKGLRRLKGLPVRGQRTHTNAKTSKRIK